MTNRDYVDSNTSTSSSGDSIVVRRSTSGRYEYEVLRSGGDGQSTTKGRDAKAFKVSIQVPKKKAR